MNTNDVKQAITRLAEDQNNSETMSRLKNALMTLKDTQNNAVPKVAPSTNITNQDTQTSTQAPITTPQITPQPLPAGTMSLNEKMQMMKAKLNSTMTPEQNNNDTVNVNAPIDKTTMSLNERMQMMKQQMQNKTNQQNAKTVIENVPTTNVDEKKETKKRTPEEEAAWQRLQEQVQKMQNERNLENNQQLNQYIQDNPPPETLLNAEQRGVAMIAMPKPGTPIDAFPNVPDGAHDEVSDLTIEDIGAVAYPDGQNIFAAFGDKTEYEGMLKAAGFKPVTVYFFPKPDSKKRWGQAKHANMYAVKGNAAKEAFEAAWTNPNHPVAIEGRQQQNIIDSRRVEMEREKNKFQENIDRIQKGAHSFTDEGYDADKHRKSYAVRPHKLTVIPTPRRIGRKPLQFTEYQMAAVSFINQRLGGKDDAKTDAERGVILADSPGIGKTMPAIGVINTNPSIKKVLVVCPSVMVPTWIREMKKWLAGDHVRNPITDKLKVSIGKYNPNNEIHDITVISYESLSKASKELSDPEKIGGRAWDYVVLDESHRVKDEHSVQACVIMGGRPKRRKTENPLVPEIQTPGNDNIEYPGIPSKRRLLLTGTPIPSYAWELYSNLHFVRPDVFNSEDEFMYQFAVMKAFRTTMWKKNKQSGTPELHRIFITKPVKPRNMVMLNKILFGGGTYQARNNKKHFDGIIMRRIHKDLEELGEQYSWPPKPKPKYLAIQENNDSANMDSRGAELTQIEKQIQDAVKRNASPDELAELEHEYNEKVKVSFRRVAKVRNAIGMRKAPYVAQEASIQANGKSEGRPNQVIVFAYHKNVIEKIAADIRQKFNEMKHPEWKVEIVYGATSDKKREDVFAEFQTDTNVKVIVASYKVLKEGITLTAANKIIHAELMPNAIDYEQAYARAWRRGQDRTVDETYMWLPRTFDQRLYNIASGKFATSNRILNHRLPTNEPQNQTSIA